MMIKIRHTVNLVYKVILRFELKRKQIIDTLSMDDFSNLFIKFVNYTTQNR